MSEDSGPSISIGDSDVPITWGNGDDEHGIGNDALDTFKDFGHDMEWTGESLSSTWDSAGAKMDADSEYFGKGVDAIEGGDVLTGLGDIGWGALEEAADVTADAIGTVADVGAGLGAGIVSVGHDIGDVAVDVGGDIVDGVEDIGGDIVDGAESLIDDIGDLF